jgi:hypothetical protein
LQLQQPLICKTMKKLILAVTALVTMSNSSFAQLGSTDKDLVYTPVTPCRVLDTRTSQGGTGAIAANSSKHFKVWGQTSFAAQGGSATNCGLTAGSDVAAVAMNFTVVTPAAGGFITAYPFGGALPVAATVNFQVGDIARGDFTIAKVTQTGSAATNHLSVFSTSLADVVGDVVGYYSKPVSAGSFECIDSASGVATLPANGNIAVYSAACNVGYAITGGSCISNTYGTYVISSQIVGRTYYCLYQNSSAADASIEATGRCCRIPGR